MTRTKRLWALTESKYKQKIEEKRRKQRAKKDIHELRYSWINNSDLTKIYLRGKTDTFRRQDKLNRLQKQCNRNIKITGPQPQYQNQGLYATAWTEQEKYRPKVNFRFYTPTAEYEWQKRQPSDKSNPSKTISIWPTWNSDSKNKIVEIKITEKDRRL